MAKKKVKTPKYPTFLTYNMLRDLDACWDSREWFEAVFLEKPDGSRVKNWLTKKIPMRDVLVACMAQQKYSWVEFLLCDHATFGAFTALYERKPSDILRDIAAQIEKAGEDVNVISGDDCDALRNISNGELPQASCKTLPNAVLEHFGVPYPGDDCYKKLVDLMWPAKKKAKAKKEAVTA